MLHGIGDQVMSLCTSSLHHPFLPRTPPATVRAAAPPPVLSISPQPQPIGFGDSSPQMPSPGGWGLHPGQVPPRSPVARAETSQRILGTCCLHWTLDEVSKAGIPEEQYQEVSPCISPRSGLCFLQHVTRALPSLSWCPVSLPFPFLP